MIGLIASGVVEYRHYRIGITFLGQDDMPPRASAALPSVCAASAPHALFLFAIRRLTFCFITGVARLACHVTHSF